MSGKFPGIEPFIIPSPQDLPSPSHKTSQDFGFDGFTQPKKSEFFTQTDLSTRSSPKRDLYFEISKRSKEPSPTSYSPSLEKTKKDYWSPHNGKFDQAKKWNYIEEILKVHSTIPGPGDYNQNFSLFGHKYRSSNGVISKPESILKNFEFGELFDQTPYFNEEDLKIKETLSKDKRGVLRHPSPRKVDKANDLSLVGPGYLAGLEKSYFRESNKVRAPSISFPKSKAPRIIGLRTRNDRSVPGVGSYVGVDLAYSRNVVKQKSRSTFISRSSLNRYTEECAKMKAWVPGPGSYNLMDVEDKNKKFKG